jgi:predicted dehydrogenase
MKMHALRWAVIGTGKISSQFSKALAKVPGHERLAVVSRDSLRGAQFAKAHGFSRSLTLEDSVFQNPDIDVFYIGTPTDTHRELCLRVIQGNKPFLCEKPMGGSLQDFVAIEVALKDTPVFAMEGMWLKFNPLIRNIADRIRDGHLGNVISGSMHVGYRDHQLSEALHPSNDALTVFGCYPAALAVEMFGVPSRVFASGRRSTGGEGLAHASVQMDFGNHSFLFECSVVAELANALHLQGDQGNLSIPHSVLDPYRVIWARAGSGRLAQKLKSRLAPLREALIDTLAFAHPLRGAGFRGEIAEIGACIGENHTQSTIHPLKATRGVHQVLVAARASIISGQWQLVL